MKQLEEKFPSPTPSTYTMAEPNAAIPLYAGPIRVAQSGKSVAGDGTVILKWHPTPRIEFVLPKAVFSRAGFGECELDLVAKGVTCEGRHVHGPRRPRWRRR